MRAGLLMLATLVCVPAAANAGGPVVVDDTGREVRLDAPARRIVTLSPHATELVFAAGAGAKLVAVAPHSDFPPAAGQLPAIGGLGGLDRERLLALAPDLVVAWDSGNRPADLAWLASRDIAIYRSEPRTLEAIAENLLDLGRLAGTEAAARTAAKAYRARLRSTCPMPVAPLRKAFIQLGERPLITVGPAHWLAQAIRRAGLQTVFPELPDRAVTIDREALLARRPEIVLYLAYPGSQADGSALPARYVALDPALWARPGPRLPAGIAALCERLAHKDPAHAVPSRAGHRQPLETATP